MTFKHFCLLFLLLVFLFSTFAFGASSEDQIKEFLLNNSKSFSVGVNPDGTCKYNRDQLTKRQIVQDLPDVANRYNLTVPYDLKPHWACNFLVENISDDSLSDLAGYSIIPQLSMVSKGWHQMSGQMKYLGFLPLPYNYSAFVSHSGKITIVVRIQLNSSFLLGTTEKDIETAKTGVKRAEALWNKSAPKGVNYRFLAVTDRYHFSIELTNTIGDLYFVYASASDDGNFWAHVIGHMLGLTDEYDLLNTIVGKRLSSDYKLNEYLTKRCSPDSLMCHPMEFENGKVELYHHALVLRRILKP